MAIRYLKHDDIDPGKWDECISQASNGLVYGYSFYLDHMAVNWDGLVMDDYAAVMPLPWNKKFGIRYVYQPTFVANTGVFGNNLTPAVIRSFIETIPRAFRIVEIGLNAANMTDPLLPSFKIRNNYILDLNQSYDQLFENYSPKRKPNIRKAISADLDTRRNLDIAFVSHFAERELKGKVQPKSDDLHRFNRLYEDLFERGQATNYCIYNMKGDLISAAVYFISHNRAYYILAASNEEGRNSGASSMVIDRFIADHAERSMILDFEGGDIESIAFLFRSFGAVKEEYPFLSLRRFPFGM